MFDEEYPKQEANRRLIELAEKYYITSDGKVCIPLPLDIDRITTLPDETFEDFAKIKNQWGYTYSDERQQELCRTLAWDGAWFRRCITDEGRFIGSESEPQAKIWLNTQSWAVLSGLGTQEQQRQAMDSVKEYLDTNLGIKKIHPAMTTDYPTKEENLTCYNKGCGENGSVFCHANTWAIIAECMLGRPENAWKYYHQLLPMIAQKTAGAERYKAEPYVYSSNIFGPESDKFGLANVSWLTGARCLKATHPA